MAEVEIVKRETGIILPEYPSLNLEPLANVINQTRDITDLKHSLEQQKKELCDVIMEDGAKTTQKLLEIADVVTQNLSYKHKVKLERSGYQSENFKRATIIFFPKGIDVNIGYYFTNEDGYAQSNKADFYLHTNKRKRNSSLSIRAPQFGLNGFFTLSAYSFFRKASYEYAYKGYEDIYKKFFELYHKMPEILTEAVGKLNNDVSAEMSKVQNESRLLQ